jgi:hypothetical protein
MNDSTEISLSQDAKIDLIGMAEKIDRFTDEVNMTDIDDDTLDKLQDDTTAVMESVSTLHARVCEHKHTRESSWKRYLRYDDCDEVLTRIESLGVMFGVALDEGKLVKWRGYNFKLRDIPKETHILRCFEEDGHRDVVKLDSEMGPKRTDILTERSDIEAMAAERKCSVYEFLITQTDTALEFVVAFHLL